MEEMNINGVPFRSIAKLERNFREGFDFSVSTAPTVYTLISVLSLICKDFSKKELEYDDSRIMLVFEDNEDSEDEKTPSIYRRYIVEVGVKKEFEYSLKIVLTGKVYFRTGNGSDISTTIEEKESCSPQNISLAHFILHGIDRISRRVREALLEIIRDFGEKLNERT